MVIQWCNLCNEAPSDGTLEVVNKVTQERDFLQACIACVNDLEATDWIDNAI